MSPSRRPYQVLLLSSPGLEELYRCCMLFVDDMAEPRETPEHPLKQIKVRAGAREARRGHWQRSVPVGRDAAREREETELRCQSFCQEHSVAQRWSFQIHVGFKFMSTEPPPRAAWRTLFPSGGRWFPSGRPR